MTALLVIGATCGLAGLILGVWVERRYQRRLADARVMRRYLGGYFWEAP